MKQRNAFAAILVASAFVGCGPPRNVPVVRPADMRDPAMFNQPVWVAFEAGDELPVYIDVEGPLFVLKPSEPVPLRVKKKCFLLLGDGPPRLSFDKETFLEGGGSFAFGLGNSVKRGAHITVTVRHAAGKDAPPQ